MELNKLLRILWLVCSFAVLWPLIVVFSLLWLIVCLRSAHVLGKPKTEGVKIWLKYLKAGIEMNKEFVLYGFGEVQ